MVGYIRMNANPRDSQTPYIDIVERTGNVFLKVRLGIIALQTQSMCLEVLGFGATEYVNGIAGSTGIKMESANYLLGNHGKIQDFM